jgi:regulator of sigma E protease
MILIHELGHYWAARAFDVKVETFSFGFGPRLFGFRKGETDFRFSAILFGGYVKMASDQPGDEFNADPRAFLAKPRWQRMIIAFAGPFVNIVLAVVLVTGLFMVRFPKIPTENSPVVGYVLPEGPAAKAGIRDGDRVVEFDGMRAPNWEDIILREVAAAKRAVTVVIERNGERIPLTVTPAFDEKSGLGYLGWMERAEIQIAAVVGGLDAERVGLRAGDILVSANGEPIRSTPKLHEIISKTGGQPVELVYKRDGQEHKVTVTPSKQEAEGQQRWMIGVQLDRRVIITQLGFVPALTESVRSNIKSAGLIYRFLEGIIERRMSPKSLEGPLRIAQISGEKAREGASAFLELMAMVSLNLAILNLLPIPILDGGVILMLLVEMLLRRDLSLRVKETVVKVGFVFLMMVVVFVLYNDLSKILPQG